MFGAILGDKWVTFSSQSYERLRFEHTCAEGEGIFVKKTEAIDRFLLFRKYIG